jgi:DnaJ-class molecular chaperone
MTELSEKSYYEILGVSFDASPDEIKEAYRSIARAYHPDSNFYDEILEAKSDVKELLPDQDKFKKITEAYNTLVNEERRKEYDKLFPKGLRDWEDIERHVSRDDFKVVRQPNEDLVGTIYRPRKNTGTFTSTSFGSMTREETEDATVESAMESALRGRSITPVDMPYDRNLMPWFISLLVGGFIAGGMLAYWLVTR